MVLLQRTEKLILLVSADGTSMDLTLLMDCLMISLFPEAPAEATLHAVIGYSLGGHAAWHALFHEPRLISAIILHGCPDFTRLMVHRAGLSDSFSFPDTERAGNGVVNSKWLPRGLLDLVKQYDPAAILAGRQFLTDAYYANYLEAVSANGKSEPDMAEKMASMFLGKRILNISGALDELVPYRCCEPFLQALEDATKPLNCFAKELFTIRTDILEGVGHDLTAQAVERAVEFTITLLLETPMSNGTVQSAVAEEKV